MPKTIRINGIDVPVIPDEMTGAEIKRTAGIPEDRVLVQQESDQNTIVPDARRIRVADGSVFAHHARHSKAAPTPLTAMPTPTEYATPPCCIGVPCPPVRFVHGVDGIATHVHPDRIDRIASESRRNGICSEIRADWIGTDGIGTGCDGGAR